MIRRPPRSTLFPLHDALPISLSDVPPGTVVLKVTRIGFGPQTRSVTVAAGASAEARFALTPQASLLEAVVVTRSEEHTSELQSRLHLVCRLLLEKKKKKINYTFIVETSLSKLYHRPYLPHYLLILSSSLVHHVVCNCIVILTITKVLRSRTSMSH